MADFSTVLIAAISAGAGVAGSVVAGHFNLKALALSHRRDYLAERRAKVADLYAELDHIEALSTVTSARALAAMNGQAAPAEKSDEISLGKVRAIVGLYFPSCQPPIDAFDQRGAEHARTLRADIEGKKVSPLTAGFAYVLVECQSRIKMCGELRGLLGEQASRLGKERAYRWPKRP